MGKRLRILGIVLAITGLGFMTAGLVAYFRVQDAYGALQKFSEAENVRLTYNDQGQLTDRGTVEGAQAILSLLENDWGYPVVKSDLNPNDPLVNTATEYMYQMATISYHTLHGTQTVVLDHDVEYQGVLYPAGTYDVPVNGRYWTAFDRGNPLDALVREQAWTGTVHGLIAELGVGTVTHTVMQLGLVVAAIFGSVGLVTLVAGLGLVWAGRERRFPDTIPTELLREQPPTPVPVG